MRLWSLHPKYLDAQGLVALWREGLLAQKVLLGRTKGYKHHPQLERFRASVNPVGAIANYLHSVADEADARGYVFDRSKIAKRRSSAKLPVSTGQVAYEFQHLLAKLKLRTPASYKKLRATKRVQAHPLFRKVRGPVAEWEVVRPSRGR